MLGALRVCLLWVVGYNLLNQSYAKKKEEIKYPDLQIKLAPKEPDAPKTAGSPILFSLFSC